MADGQLVGRYVLVEIWRPLGFGGHDEENHQVAAVHGKRGIGLELRGLTKSLRRDAGLSRDGP